MTAGITSIYVTSYANSKVPNLHYYCAKHTSVKACKLSVVQGRFEEAAACYTKALFYDPQHFQSLFNRGFSYDKLARHNDAIVDYTAAIALQPDNSYAHYNRGITRDRARDFDGAVKDFSAAIALDASVSDFFHNRGFSLRKQVRGIDLPCTVQGSLKRVMLLTHVLTSWHCIASIQRTYVCLQVCC